MSGPLAFDSEVDFDIASSFAASFEELLGTGSQLDPLHREAEATSTVNIFEEVALNHNELPTSDRSVPKERLEKGTRELESDDRGKSVVVQRKKDVKASSSKSNKARKKRFRLNHSQTRFLMNEFARQAHPDAAHRARLSKEIPGLSPRQVQVWFQNRRAKLKRLALEDRERMLKSQELQDFEEAAAAAAAAAALYGSDATIQDPAALAACFPSQQPLRVNNFHQYMPMPYGLHTDEFIQSPSSLQTCHGAGPVSVSVSALAPDPGPDLGPDLGKDIAGSLRPLQPLYPLTVDGVADWEASHIPQQLLLMHEDGLMLQGMHASRTGAGEGNDERPMSACNDQLLLQEKAFPKDISASWVDTNPFDCHHQHQRQHQQHSQGMLNLHQPSVMARPAEINSNKLYQPVMPSYCSPAMGGCNWFMGADQSSSPPPLAEQASEITDEMNLWKYQTNQFASIDAYSTPSLTYAGGVVPPQGEFPVDPFSHHDYDHDSHHHMNDDSS